MKPHPQNSPDLAPLSAQSHDAERSALADRLRQLAATSGDESRRQLSEAPLLERLLREIDETMLPREIVLYEGETAIGSVVVSQRRLVGVALAEGWRGDLIDGLRRLLMLCEKRDLRTERRVSVAPIGAESLPGEVIRTRLAAKPVRPEAAMAQFLNLAQPYLLSYVLQGEEDAAGGAPQAHDVFRQLAEQIPGRATLRAGPEALIVPATAWAGSDLTLIVARAGRLRCLALFCAPALGEVGAAWQSVFDRPPQ